MDIKKETIDECIEFVKERNWGQFHNPKDLAISLSLEASELLELFQWKDNDEALVNIDDMKDELADIIVYAIDFASVLGFFDLNEIIRNKMKKNREKYPVEKAKNSNKKYTEL